MQVTNSQILCIGEVLWDRLPEGSKPGGAPMNVAIHLNTLGRKVSVASRVGNDQAGRELLLFLENSGISTELIQIDHKLPTSEVLVTLDKDRNARFVICEPVAWDNLEATDPLISRAGDSGILIFGSLASRSSQSRETILKLLDNDAIKIMDVNFREPYNKKEVVELLLEKTDFAKLNDDELTVFAGWHDKQNMDESDLIKWLADKYKLKLVCVTKGKNGALLFCGDTLYKHPGFRVDVVDTVGAGDAFLAGLVNSLLDDKSPGESLAFACATGALVAGKAGATPFYKVDEINKILNFR
jgi:fructokinase